MSSLTPFCSSFPTRPLKFVAPLRGEKVDAVPSDAEYIGLEQLESWTGRLSSVELQQRPEGGANVFTKEDVLFGKLRPYLAKGWVADRTGFCTTECLVLQPLDTDPRFLNYSLLTSEFVEAVNGSTYGSKMPRADWAFIGSVKVPCPPRSVQQRIANFLDEQTARIDALIAEKRALIARLQEWRQAWLSEALFQGAKYRETRLKFCLRASLQYGATESGDPEASGPRYIRITDIRMDGTLTDEDAKYLTEEQASPYILEDEDVLFARSGATVGKSFVYLQEMGRCAYAGYLIRAKLDKTLLLPRYLRLLTETHQYWAYLRGAETQSTIQNASAEKYTNFAFPLPPVSVQKDVTNRLDVQIKRVEELVTHATAHTERLSEYRSSLISAAVTGQLNVDDFQARQLEAA